MLDINILNQNLNDSVSYASYFAALGYSDKDTVFFRRFKDKLEQGEKDSGRKAEAQVYNISLILDYLKQENEQDNGIFYVVNGGGQSDRDVKEAKALFIDFDDFSFQEQIKRLNEFKYEPSIIVKTRKSLHCYWILKEGDRDLRQWRELQNRLINYFGSDPSIENPSRVMRLYGFEHRKKSPLMVTLLKFNPELKYNMLPFHEILPPLTDKQARRLYGGASGATGAAESSTRTATGDIEPPESSTLEMLARDKSIRWLASWTKRHNIKILKAIEKGDGSVWYGVICPWESEHTDTTHDLESAISVEVNGKLGYNCYHGHCEERGWKDYRAFYEARDKDIEEPEGAAEETGNTADLTVSAAQKAAYMSTSAAGWLNTFLGWVKANANTPVISTGFKMLDSVLDGGLYEGLYIIGAVSSLGKTTFVLQMADQIAQQGKDVLIISLEMARTQLMAKTISRLTLKQCLDAKEDISIAKDSRGITAGERYKGYTETEKNRINEAVREYWTFAENVYIREGAGEFGASDIRDIVSNHIRITGNTPIVVVDYMQILEPKEPRATDKQNMDKAVKELKQISRDHKATIIAISSFNRANYDGAVNEASFKESGAIEYSADVLLGLQFTNVGAQNFSVTAEKKKSPREVQVVVLKQREGEVGGVVNYKYYAKYNYFVETGEKSRIKPYKQPEPERKTGRASRKKKFMQAYEQAVQETGSATIEDMARIMDVSRNTVKNYIRDFGGFNIIDNEGMVIFDGNIPRVEVQMQEFTEANMATPYDEQ